MTNCKATNCESKQFCKDLCEKHYFNFIRYGKVDGFAKQNKCSLADCTKLQKARGYCSTHYAKFNKDGHLVYKNLHDGKAKERKYAKVKAWKKANWTYYKAYLAARKKRVKQATPQWADLKAITEFYKNCPKGFHVDHVVPLMGENVSGLHTISNLQYLSKQDNLKKRNIFPQNLRESTLTAALPYSPY